MVGNLEIGLTLALVGMGLVFAALLLLAIAVVLLRRLGQERAGHVQSTTGEGEAGDGRTNALDYSPAQTEIVQSSAAEPELRRRAAAAAVAVAVAIESQRPAGPQPFPIPPTALVSAWQAVMRAGQLGRRGAIR